MDSCSTCAFYLATVISQAHGDRGICRRYPPQSAINPDAAHAPMPAQPIVYASDWCGEWEKA